MFFNDLLDAKVLEFNPRYATDMLKANNGDFFIFDSLSGHSRHTPDVLHRPTFGNFNDRTRLWWGITMKREQECPMTH